MTPMTIAVLWYLSGVLACAIVLAVDWWHGKSITVSDIALAMLFAITGPFAILYAISSVILMIFGSTLANNTVVIRGRIKR